MSETTINPILCCIIIIAALFAILILVALAKFFNDFTHELRYLNCEINRTEGEERRYYIRRKRRLWLSILPFIKY